MRNIRKYIILKLIFKLILEIILEIILSLFSCPCLERPFFWQKYAPHAGESSIFEAPASQNRPILGPFLASKTRPKIDPTNEPKKDPPASASPPPDNPLYNATRLKCNVKRAGSTLSVIHRPRSREHGVQGQINEVRKSRARRNPHTLPDFPQLVSKSSFSLL